MDPGGAVSGSVSVSAQSDSTLLAGLRRQDESAYERLVRDYGGMLFATAKRIVRREEDARDVVQETFLQVFRSLDSFEGSSRLSTWMHRIAVNASLMKLRTDRRHPEASIEPLLPSFLEDGHHALPTSWSPDVSAGICREETKSLVREAIGELPESYRTVLMLRDIEGLDTDETAAVLAITPNAVKIRLHRARQALRTLLDETYGEALP